VRHRIFWLVPVLLVAACGPSVPSPPELSPSSVAAPIVTPLRLADCQHPSATSPPGSLPLAGGKSRPIVQPPLKCDEAFEAYADFTALGDVPGCRNVPEAVDPDLGRPCHLPLRAEPNYKVVAYAASVWRPVEGKDLLRITCQAVGNSTLSEGTLRNVRGEVSNVWDKVADQRLPGGFGWANDLWLGNAGWRNVPC
jgi:hypothetical protein